MFFSSCNPKPPYHQAGRWLKSFVIDTVWHIPYRLSLGHRGWENFTIRQYVGLSLGIAGLLFAGDGAVAKPKIDPSACTVAGLVQGGGIVDGEKIRFEGSGGGDLPWTSAFGEAALNYVCGTWGGQIDGAAYGFWTKYQNSVPPSPLSMMQGHAGGEVFWRDPSSAAYGIAVSRIFQSYDADFGQFKLSDHGGIWRVGGFAEIYPSDMLTLGGGAYYLNGRTSWIGTPENQRGFEGDVFVKIYPSDHLSLTARGDVLVAALYDINTDTKGDDYTGFALSAEGEYLIPDTAFSLFAGGRIANRKVAHNSNYFTMEDTQGYLGAKFAFGGPPPSSLRDRDRHGTFDNTSVFQEKLPNIDSEQPFD